MRDLAKSRRFNASTIIQERLSGVPRIVGQPADELPVWINLEEKELTIVPGSFDTLEGKIFARSSQELATVLDQVLTAANFEHHFGGLVVFLHAVDRKPTDERPGYAGLEIKFYYGAKAPRR